MVGDVLKTDLPYFDVCVANLPYQVKTGALLGWSSLVTQGKALLLAIYADAMQLSVLVFLVPAKGTKDRRFFVPMLIPQVSSRLSSCSCSRILVCH